MAIPGRRVGRAAGRAAPGRPHRAALAGAPGRPAPGDAADDAGPRAAPARLRPRRRCPRPTATRCGWSRPGASTTAARRWPASPSLAQLVPEATARGQPLRPRPAWACEPATGSGCARRGGAVVLAARADDGRARRASSSSTSTCPGRRRRPNAAATLIDATAVVNDVRLETAVSAARLLRHRPALRPRRPLGRAPDRRRSRCWSPSASCWCR